MPGSRSWSGCATAAAAARPARPPEVPGGAALLPYGRFDREQLWQERAGRGTLLCRGSTAGNPRSCWLKAAAAADLTPAAAADLAAARVQEVVGGMWARKLGLPDWEGGGGGGGGGGGRLCSARPHSATADATPPLPPR